VFDDLGVYRLLATLDDVVDIQRFVEQWLGWLIEYDANHGAELVRTIEAYVESGRSVGATSSSLDVHRNTVKYRLRRITELSGLDLTDPDTAFNVQFAGRALRILDVLGGVDQPERRSGPRAQA
jgi:DNA-binding PucR family transcriptional regulator